MGLARYEDHPHYFAFDAGLRLAWLKLKLRLDNTEKFEKAPLMFWPFWSHFLPFEDRSKIFVPRGGGQFGLPLYQLKFNSELKFELKIELGLRTSRWKRTSPG